MKRGLIAWDQAELTPASFHTRLDAVRQELAQRDLPAVVIHTDIWKSNQGRFFSNFMPYWNRALLVIPRVGAPVLLCGLSPRVYPWIRSVTILDEIRPGANLAQALLQLCTERQWTRIAALDFPQFPYDLHAPISSSSVEVLDLPSTALPEHPDESEQSMYRTAAHMARTILEEALPHGSGQSDYSFTGELERQFRRAGAEDLVIRLTNGQTPPLPAKGRTLEAQFSVAVALEYRGHWVKVARARTSAEAVASILRGFEQVMSTLAGSAYVETLSGLYPYQACELADVNSGSLFALHVEQRQIGQRLFYGDTCLRSQNGASLL